MTQHDAAAVLRRWGMTLTKFHGEFRVNYLKGDESTAYYTTDLHDAFAVAEFMHRQRQRELAMLSDDYSRILDN